MTTRIGMISFAHLHAHSYAASLKQIPEQAEIAGVFDDNPERGKEAAEGLNVPFFDSCEQLLEQDIQGVVICSENAKHKDFALQSAEAGKHILCEKPISISVPDAQSMIDSCSKNNIKLMIAFPCRFITSIVRIYQLLQEGRLGKILAMKGTNRGTMPGGWFIEKNLAGGGAVMDHTVHVVDAWRWMLNKDVVSVYAESDQLFYSDINIDDTGLLSLEFEGGIFATLDTSWSRPNASFPTWGDVTMEIVGEKGSLSLDAFRQQLEIYNNDMVKSQWVCWTDDPNLAMIKGFIKMIENNDESPVPGYDGLKAMEVALAAYRSIEAKGPVALPLI